MVTTEDHGLWPRPRSLLDGLHEIWRKDRHLYLLAAVLVLCAYWFGRQIRARRDNGRFPLRTELAASSKSGKDEVLPPKPQAREAVSVSRSETDDKYKDGGQVRQVRPRMAPKKVTRGKSVATVKTQDPGSSQIQPVIFYFSLTDTTKNYAYEHLRGPLEKLSERSRNILRPQIYDLAHIDHEDYFERLPTNQGSSHVRFFYMMTLPSYNIDTVLDSFLQLLSETHNDFRIDTAPLANIAGYSVFGFGDLEGWPSEGEGFCTQAIEVDKWMAKLTAKKRAFPLGLGNVKSHAGARFAEWRDGMFKALMETAETGNLGEGVLGSGNPMESDECESDSDSENKGKPQSTKARSKKTRAPNVDDLEDLGSKARSSLKTAQRSNAPSAPLAIDFTNSSRAPTTTSAPKLMVPATSPTHAALTKQGYTIIGSHSGVKICRWTKSALRGRGSCYKFSFYGIKSHLCMETTPSLSCSNKCVFCWRHGTNPVGTTWRWEIDPPEMIFEGAKAGHYRKIKTMKGVPGVRAERFQEAMQIKHCALSLVGEPIFYPHINEFVGLLHKERISTFLVCNAQHPDQLAALKPVTQLYVSIDASNAESLRKIDRPLHRDFWQRFLRCLDILQEKRFSMRTVFRLTLVKGFNIDDEVEGYADLVARGLPCFVEIKGVTYCGTSSSAGAGLTMQNVPFYKEVVAFVEALNAALERRGLGYGIAAEHAHSCCALIGSKRFYVNEKWHTLIGYDKFFGCLESGEPFRPEDYMGEPTPEWALWGNGGFDPADERVYRKSAANQKASESQIPKEVL